MRKTFVVRNAFSVMKDLQIKDKVINRILSKLPVNKKADFTWLLTRYHPPNKAKNVLKPY